MKRFAGDYRQHLPRLVEEARFADAPPDRVVDLIVDWLESDDDGPFNDGPFNRAWHDLGDWCFVWNAGDLQVDARSMVHTCVELTKMLRGRRLAWVLADLEADASFLRPIVENHDGGSQGERALQVRDELRFAVAPAAEALGDEDARARGFAAGLLANLTHLRMDLPQSPPFLEALNVERDPVVRATLLLAARTSTHIRVLEENEAAIVGELNARGALAPIWGSRPDVPMILGNAIAKVRQASMERGGLP